MNTGKYTLEELKDLLKDNPKLPKEARTVIEKAIAEKEKSGAKKSPAKPKAKTTPKKTTTRKKTAKPKATAEQKAEKKRKVSQATGKTLEECKEILAKYEALRGKTTAKDKQRVEKLEKEDKLIDGTTTKTAEATTETTTKTVPAKIKKEVNAIEKEAEAEAKKEVSTSGKTKAEVSKEVKEVKEKKIEKKVEDMTSDLADAGKKFIKSIQTEIAKFSKDDAKKFLLDIKSQVDTLLKAYAYGGELEGAVQHYNIAWAGGDRPLPEYAKGGQLGKLNVLNTDEENELIQGVSFEELNNMLSQKFRDSFGLKIYKRKPDHSLMTEYNEHLKPKELKGIKFIFRDKSINPRTLNFEVSQGGENTNYNFALYDLDYIEYVAEFGFKDRGDVPKEYVTRFIAFLCDAYGFPFKADVYKKGGKLKQNKTMRKYARGGSVEDTPKIYVADLEAYNNGMLKGDWLDLTDYSSGEEVLEAINDLIDGEEYAIHDYENLPSSMYSEYMGEADFDKIIEVYEASDNIGIPADVILEFMEDKGIDDVSSVEDAFMGSAEDEEDYAYQLVEEGVYRPHPNDVYVTETDRRVIAGDEESNFRSNAEYEGEMSEEEIDEEADRVYDEWYEGLGSDPVYFLSQEMGMYSEEEAMKLPWIMKDYEKIARELSYDFTFITGNDGDVYVFSNHYAKGGKVSRKRKKRSSHSIMQDRRRKSSEPWEVAYQKRKGKRKFEEGGQVEMFSGWQSFGGWHTRKEDAIEVVKAKRKIDKHQDWKVIQYADTPNKYWIVSRPKESMTANVIYAKGGKTMSKSARQMIFDSLERYGINPRVDKMATNNKHFVEGEKNLAVLINDGNSFLSQQYADEVAGKIFNHLG